ncbi:MAG: guanylate kinase [Anaerolineae bacterium]|nr:guanylate kinase [Anaerolineae bacterium]
MPAFNESSQQWGLLFILVGPPGVGKNAMMNSVLERITSLHQLPTATTRPIRSNEQEGREHLFVSTAEFQRMIDQGELIEWQVVHGHQYGTPRSTVQQAMETGQDLIADIEVLGATHLRSAFPENVILVFVQPPSVDELIHRMHNRGETEAEIQKRMQRVEMELRYAPECDYLITNDSIERASDILRGIILAEYSRRDLKRLRANSEALTPA